MTKLRVAIMSLRFFLVALFGALGMFQAVILPGTYGYMADESPEQQGDHDFPEDLELEADVAHGDVTHRGRLASGEARWPSLGASRRPRLGRGEEPAGSIASCASAERGASDQLVGAPRIRYLARVSRRPSRARARRSLPDAPSGRR